ncbi:MAG: flagellar basal body L-ring protein FlgH [Acetobacteraceae bacterium]|nr:flagellar basal body L-ring protein FlgH [Acetobacteraceae bacterium]MBV8522717.1 flagellar basal body L-ring protein FlgH [Acetobacteraceae bacterium]MBV8590075.1 flagellar basal body L-ring protein FlgH [Acetobacteraceae bacterium]
MTKVRALLLIAPVLLSGCDTLTRLSEVGRPPVMTPPSDPTRSPYWQPVSMPMPAAQPVTVEANSLWRPGSRAFFKDQRAAQVGDLITVLVNITDNADVENQSSRNSNGAENWGVPNFFGLQYQIPKMVAGAAASDLLSMNSTGSNTGVGKIKRNETVTLRLAGVVTQVLPNGNLVIMARQEVRVNSELRELQVSGVIRPQDIASDNTVHHDRLAEARIAYGGRGQLTDVQTPRWGQQVLDLLLPF